MTQTNCSSCGEQLTLKEGLGTKTTDCFCDKCKKIILKELADDVNNDYRKVSIYVLEESVDYQDCLYSRDECNYCDECGEETPEDFMEGDICSDCRSANEDRESLEFDCRSARRI